MTDVPDVPVVQLDGGVSMPMVGFGTWRLSGRGGYEAIRSALDAGYRHIDTATMYRNEDEVGRAVRDSGLDRRDIFVTTKLPSGAAGRERATIVASLRALDMDYVDLWLVHWPPNGKAAPEVWEQFLAVRDDGLARAVGVSNYSPDQIDELVTTTGQRPAVNQIPWSPARHDPELLAAHRERGMAVEGYSPLKDTNLRAPALAQVAARHGVAPAQVVLRWHLDHGITVIPKSARRDRIVSNIDLFGFSLAEEEIALLDGMAGG